MRAVASHITSLTIFYSTVYSGADQRKHWSSAWRAFVRGIHRWSVNSPHKWPVTRKMFPFDDVIMTDTYLSDRIIWNALRKKYRNCGSIGSLITKDKMGSPQSYHIADTDNKGKSMKPVILPYQIKAQNTRVQTETAKLNSHDTIYKHIWKYVYYTHKLRRLCTCLFYVLPLSYHPRGSAIMIIFHSINSVKYHSDVIIYILYDISKMANRTRQHFYLYSFNDDILYYFKSMMLRLSYKAGVALIVKNNSFGIEELFWWYWVWSHNLRLVHWANMGPTWVLMAPDGPHVGPMNLAIRDLRIKWACLISNKRKKGSSCAW